MADLAPACRSCRRCRERCHTWQLHRSPDTPHRLGQAFSPRTIRNPVVRQNSSGLSIISALVVTARSTPDLRLITMFTPRRNPCFDVLPHFHHRQSISDKQPKLRTWLESRTVTARLSLILNIIIFFQGLQGPTLFNSQRNCATALAFS
jgi:hypothetical protein